MRGSTHPKARRVALTLWAFPGARAALVAVLAVSLLACGTLAPGEDPVVVRTQQALAAGDALYADAMAYYFSPGVAQTLPPNVTKVFESVRTGFDPAYKDVQKTLETYQAVKAAVAAGKAGDVAAQQQAIVNAVGKLAALINQVIGQIPAKALPKSGGKPVQAGG